MSEHFDYTGKIVVGTNGSAIARSAVDWAAERAVAKGRPLVVLLITPDMPSLSRGEIMSKVDRVDDLVDGMRRRAEDRLEAEHARLAEKYPGLPVEAHMLVDDASFPLARATRTAELVVIGSRSHSAPLSARALGGTSAAVAAHAHGPVVVVHGGDRRDRAVPASSFRCRRQGRQFQPPPWLQQVRSHCRQVRISKYATPCSSISVGSSSSSGS